MSLLCNAIVAMQTIGYIYVCRKCSSEAMPCGAAGITSAESGPVPVHWNAPNGTWVTTSSSNPASPGGPVRLPSPEAAPAEASAASGMQNWLCICTDFIVVAFIWLMMLQAGSAAGWYIALRH